MASKIILTQDEIRRIIDLYNAGKSSKIVGEETGYSTSFIKTTLINNGVILRKYHEINKKYTINEEFFDVIDTEEKAYFLGFLYADGNIHSKYNAITLKLQKQDREILTKWSNLIYGFEHILESENNYLVKFSSNHMKNRLIELGCHPNKTFTLEYPKILKSSLQNHFIRGFMDGDGTIVKDKNNFYVGFIGTEKMCAEINNQIFNNTGILSKIEKDKKMIEQYGNTITSKILFRGNRRTEKVLDWIYKDSIIYLKRKYNKYLDLKNRVAEVDRTVGYNKKIILTDTDIHTIKQLYNDGETYAKIGKIFGYSRSFIKKVIKSI